VNSTALALLAASAGVGFGHAVLPDHWVPLAVVGRTRHYPMAKIARLSSLAGLAHVLLSIALGAVIIVIGLRFRSTIESAQNIIIGGLLAVTGIGFVVLEMTGHGHHHPHDHPHDHAHDHPHDHAHDHPHDHGHADTHSHAHGAGDERGHHAHPGPGDRHGLRGLPAVMIPFGAAASPDLTILPVFLAATTAGVATAVGSVVVFAAATIGTIVGLTLAAARGGYQIKGDWMERRGNLVTAAVLLIIGALVLLGVI
jgi:ABC-type nickel/cobalt efflux system permease component RcnA